MPSSVQIDLPEPLAVVCHDAGASNLIIAWLRHYRGVVHVCAQGPALALWPKAFPDADILPLEDALNDASTLITGTSWASDIEHRARKRARTLVTRSIAVIDHWVNYRERFIRDGELVLPGELWVADDDAYVEARRCFSGFPIRQLPNLYLEDLVHEVEQYDPLPPRQSPRNILYLLEPIRQNWGHDDRPGELQAFEFFLNRLPEMSVDSNVQIRLRPHPSDAVGKYADWPGRFPGTDLTIDVTASLSRLIAWADWVVGCESFALVIALHAKRIVISSTPPWAPRCRLPHRKLVHLRDQLPALR